MRIYCDSCGNKKDYEIRMTADGYKEYVCSCCGTILDRVNLIEEYKQLHAEHDYAGETDLAKLEALRAKYCEDYSYAYNYMNYVSVCQAKAQRTATKDQLKAYDRILAEYHKLLAKLHKLKHQYDGRIATLREELAYVEVSASLAASYDPKKTYKAKAAKEEKNSSSHASWLTAFLPGLIIFLIPIAVIAMCALL